MTEGRRLAFVMGSNGPSDKSQLKYARSDAHGLAQVLSSKKCRFVVERPSSDATSDEARNAFLRSVEECVESDTFVCSFAGHAVLDAGDLFLLWHSSERDRLLSTALSGAEIFRALNRCRAARKLLILDCCHAGAMIPGIRNQPTLSQFAPTERSFVLMLASDKLEFAREFDDLGGGFLTTHLRQALTSRIDEVDADGDGQVSVDDLMVWLRTAATNHNAERPDQRVPVPVKLGKEQGKLILAAPAAWRPWTFSLNDVDMVLVPVTTRGDRWSGASLHVVAVAVHPTTNRQYREFVDEGSWWGPKLGPPVGQRYDLEREEWIDGFLPWDDPRFNDDDMPVVCVSYQDARRYCGWLSERVDRGGGAGDVELSLDRDPSFLVGLPSSAVWDYVAFGSEVGRPSSIKLRRNAARRRRVLVQPQASIHDTADGPAPVDGTGSRTNSLGVSDLLGNVWEWCLTSSLHETHPWHSDRISAGSVAEVELRGGGFLDDMGRTRPYLNARELRGGLGTRHSDLGFRIAVPVDPRSLTSEFRELIDSHAVEVEPDAYTGIPRLQ